MRIPLDPTVTIEQLTANPYSIYARLRAECPVVKVPAVDRTLIDGAGNFSGVKEVFNRADQANDEINASIAKAISVGRENDGDSALAEQAYAEHPLEMEHIISNIKIAIGGGINEPRDSILTAVYALLANPEQRVEIQNDVVLFGKAFDEAVRWVAPIQVSARRATQDTVIGDYELAKDEVLLTAQASANHDEDEYEDGHVFNLFRKEQRHQSFGNGPHFCMGTHLSRKMVGDIALPKLFERFPNMRLSNEVSINH